MHIDTDEDNGAALEPVSTGHIVGIVGAGTAKGWTLFSPTYSRILLEPNCEFKTVSSESPFIGDEIFFKEDNNDKKESTDKN